MTARQKRNTSPNRPAPNPGPYMDPPRPLTDTPDDEMDPLAAGRRDPDKGRGQSDSPPGQDQSREGGGANRGPRHKRTQDSETGRTDAEPDGNRDNPGRSSGDQR